MIKFGARKALYEKAGSKPLEGQKFSRLAPSDQYDQNQSTPAERQNYDIENLPIQEGSLHEDKLVI